MLRERILEYLAGAGDKGGWVSFASIARDLHAPIADVMYETGALCELKYAQKDSGRATGMVRLTNKGFIFFTDLE